MCTLVFELILSLPHSHSALGNDEPRKDTKSLLLVKPTFCSKRKYSPFTGERFCLHLFHVATSTKSDYFYS